MTFVAPSHCIERERGTLLVGSTSDYDGTASDVAERRMISLVFSSAAHRRRSHNLNVCAHSILLVEVAENIGLHEKYTMRTIE